MTRGRPVEPETRESVRAAILAGTSRNQIAKDHGIGAATVTKLAQEFGLSFDRSLTEAAVKARTVDLAVVRVTLATKMAAAAEAMLDRIDDEYLVYNFGGKDNTYEEHVLESAPIEVRRSIVVTAGIAFDKVSRIVERDSGGPEQAFGVLDQLAAGFAAAASRIRGEDGPTDAA